MASPSPTTMPPSHLHFGAFMFLSLLSTNLAMLYVTDFAGRQVFLGVAIPALLLVGIFLQRGLLTNPVHDVNATLVTLLGNHIALVRSPGSPDGAPHAPTAAAFETTRIHHDALLRRLNVPLYESDTRDFQQQLHTLASRYVEAQQRRLEDRAYSFQATQTQLVYRPQNSADSARVFPNYAPCIVADHSPFGRKNDRDHDHSAESLELSPEQGHLQLVGAAGVVRAARQGPPAGETASESGVIETVTRYASSMRTPPQPLGHS